MGINNIIYLVEMIAAILAILVGLIIFKACAQKCHTHEKEI